MDSLPEREAREVHPEIPEDGPEGTHHNGPQACRRRHRAEHCQGLERNLRGQITWKISRYRPTKRLHH